MSFGVVDTPEYRKLNPVGKVPCIVHGDFVLWESNSIMRYFARCTAADGASKPGVLLGVTAGEPVNERLVADADRWSEYFNTVFWNDMHPVFWGLVRTPPEKRNAKKISEGRTRLEQALRIVDGALVGRSYLAGERFTYGDIPMALIAYRWFNLPIDRAPLPHLDAWYARVASRPAFVQHCKLPLT